jgi:hypothetical protein
MNGQQSQGTVHRKITTRTDNKTPPRTAKTHTAVPAQEMGRAEGTLCPFEDYPYPATRAIAPAVFARKLGR